MKMKDTKKLYNLIGKKIQKDGFVGTLTHITDSEFTLVNENGVEKTFSRKPFNKKPSVYLLLQCDKTDVDDVFIEDMPQYYKEGYEITKLDGSTIYFGGQSEAKKWLVEHKSEVAPFKNATAVVKGEEPWNYIKFNVPARKASDVDFAKNQLYYIEKNGEKTLYCVMPEFVGHVNMQSGQGDFPSNIKPGKIAGPAEHSYYLGTFNTDEEMQEAAEEFVNVYNKDYDAYNNAKNVVSQKQAIKTQNIINAHTQGSETQRNNNTINVFNKKGNLKNWDLNNYCFKLNRVNEARKGEGLNKSDIVLAHMGSFISKCMREKQGIIPDINAPVDISPQVLVFGSDYGNIQNVLDYSEIYTERIKDWLADNGLSENLVNSINFELSDASYCCRIFEEINGYKYSDSYRNRNTWYPNEDIPQSIIDVVNINIV